MRFRLAESLLYGFMKLLHALDRRRRDTGDFRPEDVRSILLVSSTAIGDTLLSTPAIRAVRERYPRARIIAHFNRDNMELFKNNPRIDGIIPYYGGYRRFLRTVMELRRYRFDLVLILHGNEPQATPMAYLSGAPFIFKLPNTSRFRFLLSNREPVVGWDGLGHGIEARLKTASLCGCDTMNKRMELFIDRRDEERVSVFLEREGVRRGDILVGFQPGASTLSRMWFPDRFVELGRRLIKDIPRCWIVITGSPSEKALCESIGDCIGGRTIVTSGRVALRELPPLVKRLSVFVTGDTGPMHVAFSLGTPVVALYAVADPEKTGPYYDREKHRVIKKERICDPCVSKRCEYQKCMENIEVDEVFRMVKELLEKVR